MAVQRQSACTWCYSAFLDLGLRTIVWCAYLECDANRTARLSHKLLSIRWTRTGIIAPYPIHNPADGKECSFLWVWVLIAPSLERIGYWDHWTSWSLYSPHTSRARIEIHQSGFEKLDESILESLSPDHDGDQWYELDLSLWSLSERGVPIYPQARYQLEIAAYISARYDFFDELRVKLQGISDRRTGRRDEKRYFNAKEIQSARTLFWLHPGGKLTLKASAFSDTQDEAEPVSWMKASIKKVPQMKSINWVPLYLS